ATFQLRIIHPVTMNVYSNTEITRTEPVATKDRIKSIFAKTHVMPTYQLALSVNNFPIRTIAAPGYTYGSGKVRIMYSQDVPRDISLRNVLEEPVELINKSLDSLSRPMLDVADWNLMNQKLDVIFLDGTSTVTVQPGI
ncbi:hypothetical protein PFISCL1PPCAC_21174, partial [Pristionchus fissidentatus]